MQAIKIVFAERRYAVIGMLAALAFGAIFVFGSGMVLFFPQGPFIEVKPLRIITLLLLTALAGLVIPMQWFALKKARRVWKEGASGVGGLFAGMATMSCCAPLLLPAFLAFVGFSGMQLLYLNAAVRQYAVPLSLLSVGLLTISLFMVSRSIVTNTCRVIK